MSGKCPQIQLLTQSESWVIVLTAQVERDGTLPSVQHLPHVPHLPPKYPYPNSHYQPLTTKAFMKIGVIATGVASSVTLDKICPIMVFTFGKILKRC